MQGYVGQQVVGIDLHRRRTVIVRTDAERRGPGDCSDREQPDRADGGDRSSRTVAGGRAGGHLRLVLGRDVLQESGARVHLAHPLGVKGFAYRRVKNDVRDAPDLADLLRMGRLPEAWIAPPPTRELRELVRHRAKLVALRSCCRAQVHSVLAKCGVAVPMSDLFAVAGGRAAGPTLRAAGCPSRPGSLRCAG